MKKLILLYLITLGFNLFSMEIEKETEKPETKRQRVTPEIMLRTEEEILEPQLESQEVKKLSDIAFEKFISYLIKSNITVDQVKELLKTIPEEMEQLIKNFISKPLDPIESKLIHHAKTPLEVQKLIFLGADPMAKDNENIIPLIYMLKSGNDLAAIELLKNIDRLAPDSLLYPRFNPSYDVITYVINSPYNKQLANLLLHKGITEVFKLYRYGVKLPDSTIKTARNNSELLKILNKMGYNIQKIPAGTTTLMRAIIDQESLEVIKNIIESGTVDINATNQDEGETALMLAAQYYPAAIDLLIQAGANIKQEDLAGFNALDIATIKQNLVAVNKLVPYYK